LIVIIPNKYYVNLFLKKTGDSIKQESPVKIRAIMNIYNSDSGYFLQYQLLTPSMNKLNHTFQPILLQKKD